MYTWILNSLFVKFLDPLYFLLKNFKPLRLAPKINDQLLRIEFRDNFVSYYLVSEKIYYLNQYLLLKEICIMSISVFFLKELCYGNQFVLLERVVYYVNQCILFERDLYYVNQCVLLERAVYYVNQCIHDLL